MVRSSRAMGTTPLPAFVLGPAINSVPPYPLGLRSQPDCQRLGRPPQEPYPPPPSCKPQTLPPCPPSGTALATGGEDGQVKIWSRNGMLRSSLTQCDSPVYCVVWGWDSDQICFCSGSNVTIRSCQSSQRQVTWKAHEGVVLKVGYTVTVFRAWRNCAGGEFRVEGHQGLGLRLGGQVTRKAHEGFVLKVCSGRWGFRVWGLDWQASQLEGSR